MNLSPQQIVNTVKNAGIIGAGGGGFPTYVKLQAQVDTIIANGSECEPILSSDRTMMVKKAEQLIAGIQYAMQATNAKQGVIGLKKHYTDAIVALTEVLPQNGSIRLHLLDNYYPAGDEFLLVYEITGKVIPEGGLPLQSGVVVNNVITLMQIAEAIDGKPVVERTVTLAGEFNNPQVINVPIGTTYNDLAKIAGGLKNKDVVLIDGGPMMGKIVNNWQDGISKTTSGVIALPHDHFVVRMAEKPLGQMIKQSKAACCQCFRCSDLCPRNLLGHNLFPHATMRTIDYNQAEPKEHITAAFLCSQCGLCELIACDFMLLSPRKIYAAYRKELSTRGIKNPHQRANLVAREAFPDRKVAIPTLIKKLDLTNYDQHLTYNGKIAVNHVRIILNKHIGTPAVPCVKLGQKVRMCDVVAASPNDKLGSVCHASISGKVTEITENTIEITG